MIYRNSMRRWTLCALPLALILSASLTGCSNLSEALKNNKSDTAGLQLKVVADTKTLPDAPPEIVRCIQADAKQGKTANDKVINLIGTASARQLCGNALIAWYQCVQKANDPKSAECATEADKMAKIKPAKVKF